MRLQVQATPLSERARFFSLEPQVGEGDPVELYRFQWIAGSTHEGFNSTDWGELESGAPAVYTAGEGAYRLLLFVTDAEAVGERLVRLDGGGRSRCCGWTENPTEGPLEGAPRKKHSEGGQHEF